MAVSFRHGSNGSYKSAYAVWFEIVPALREGRIVVTNVEGLKSLSGIEKALGEKFPSSTRLIRIFSRSEEGVRLWQNWFCWMPTGAFVVIDECQDLFTTDVGFKREKAVYHPVEEFKDDLPADFLELFYSRWLPVPEDARHIDGEEDDTGRTQYDEHGRLVYPYNFYGAFMRHRKYQWDIVLLTPDWTSIPTWMRGCAQEAYSHRSTDTFFRKRRPRIFNHKPQSSKSQPSTKADFASCTSKKIPLDVFALYKSTGTGGFNESKADLTMLKSPKFLVAMLIALLSMGYFLWSMYHVFFSDTVDSNQASVASASGASHHSNVVEKLDSKYSADTSSGRKNSSSVVDSGRRNESDHTPDNVDTINPFKEAFPIFNSAKHVYLTGELKTVGKKFSYTKFVFRIDMPDGSYYVRSHALAKYGYYFEYIDDCLVSVKYGKRRVMVMCAPYSNQLPVSNDKALDDRKKEVHKSVDLFSL
ncbi:zonular occludens toxin [Vibrio sp. CAIM 722]|uniref:Zonular occludens toxin n=1 Tax=Vibrio eleionomae TaxID=2653505 RepID=A0A7X4LK35_9VIBR|nr:zonular occludens toxin domain-containing protein [Vibrio eleionomae]MZI93245.1 zonular occludens toxin [Vibrio eleionomae]